MIAQPKTDAEAVKKYLELQAEYLSSSYTSREINDALPSPEDSTLNIVLFGELVATKIDHDPGNVIDGQWEYQPFDYVSKWEFIGDITVENEKCEVIKTIQKQNQDVEI